ncbi:MAG: LpqB family beta-propeller domain-containing protein [Candidatus Poribacteria bacterium]
MLRCVRELPAGLLTLALLIGGCSEDFTDPAEGAVHRNHGSPAWSPNGQSIAFTVGFGGSSDIYVMDADGSNPRKLADHAGNLTSPTWSPDGKSIAFASHSVFSLDGPPTSADIYVMDADGANQRNLTNHPRRDFSPTWSPDGKSIAFASAPEGNLFGDADIHVIDADGKSRRSLTNQPNNESSPAWSPDGNSIAFIKDQRVGDAISSEATSDVYVMNVTGAEQRNLTNHPGFTGSPAWSPDGKGIAFYARRGGNGDIYVMDADGANQWRLTNPDNWDASPAWSPDGKSIVFASAHEGAGVALPAIMTYT